MLLAGSFVAFTVGAGLMHSYTVFLVAFIQAFAWSRAETSIPYSVSQFVTGASSPLVGAMVDRLGPQRIAAVADYLSRNGYRTATNVSTVESGATLRSSR